MVRLTKIYTRTGDEGQTGLGDGSRVAKTDPRVAAYADVDEANSAIGVAVAHGAPSELVALLTQIQNDLFDLGADLATPRGAYGSLFRIDDAMVSELENQIDRFNADLPELDSFVLPGGTVLAANLHLARAITRRAERSTWHAIEALGEGEINPNVAKYLNRLSDLLFVLARTANKDVGDVKWTQKKNPRQ
jgi:cob(I)alamin adenosyltransferase